MQNVNTIEMLMKDCNIGGKLKNDDKFMFDCFD